MLDDRAVLSNSETPSSDTQGNHFASTIVSTNHISHRGTTQSNKNQVGPASKVQNDHMAAGFVSRWPYANIGFCFRAVTKFDSNQVGPAYVSKVHRDHGAGQRGQFQDNPFIYLLFKNIGLCWLFDSSGYDFRSWPILEWRPFRSNF